MELGLWGFRNWRSFPSSRCNQDLAFRVRIKGFLFWAPQQSNSGGSNLSPAPTCDGNPKPEAPRPKAPNVGCSQGTLSVSMRVRGGAAREPKHRRCRLEV